MGTTQGELTEHRFPAGIDGDSVVRDSSTTKGMAAQRLQGVVVKSLTSGDSPYTMLANEDTIIADAVGGAITVTLPPVASMKGRRVVVKRINSGANAVTIQPGG